MSIGKFFSYIILSFCMLNLQLAPTFFEVSALYAQEAGQAGSVDTSTVNASQSAAAQQELDKVAAGVNTKSFKGEDEGSMGSFMNILMMIIIGFVTASLLYACTQFTADTMVAAAGGAIYIMAELMELFNSKEEANNREIPYTVNDYGVIQEENQRAALVEERKAYQSVKDSAENKAKYQKAAAAAFTAAAVVALGLHAMLTSTLTACITAGAAIAKSNPKDALVCTPATTAATDINTKLQLSISKPSDVEAAEIDTEANITQACAPCTGTVVTAVLNSVAACTKGLTALSYNDHQEKLFTPMLQEQYIALSTNAGDSLIESIFTLIIPKANASFMELLGGLGGGLLAAWALNKKFSGVFDTFLGKPLTRGIIFGVLAMMAFTAASTSEKIAKKMQKNIDVIDSILNRYDRFAESKSAVGTPASSLSGLSGNQARLRQIGTNQNKFPCLAKTKSGKCAQVSKLLNNSLPQTGVNFDPLTTSAIGTAGRIADGASGQVSLSPGTDGLVGDLAGNQGALAKRLKKMEDDINKNLKKAGKKGINFDKLKNKYARGMKARIARSLKSQGKTAQGIVGSMSPVIANAPFANENLDDLIKEGTGESAIGFQGGGVQAAASASGSRPSFSFGMDDEDSSGIVGADARPEDFEDNMDNVNFKIDNNNDIIEDDNVDIFQVITTRYIKNYDKLFEKKKEDVDVLNSGEDAAD